MDSNRKLVRLADLCEAIDYGFTASASEVPVGSRFLRITDIVPGFIDWNSVPYVKIDDGAAKRVRLHHGDVVIARTGATTGVSAWISSPPDAVFASYLVRIRTKRDVDSRFIAYFLKSKLFWDYMHGVLGDKSAQPNASATTMTNVLVPLPPEQDQRAISAILGALDDKIELNRRSNETLEAMARALFKSWFVDFDPVRAKAEGREPAGMDAAMAALFPDSFEKSVLGEIPRGWRALALGGAFRLTMGQSPPGSSYNEMGQGLPFYQGTRDFGFRYPTTRVYCTAPTRFAEPDDTLVSVRAPVGTLNLAAQRCCIGRGVAAVRHKSGSSAFTYRTMQALEAALHRFEGEGTVFGSINKDQFEKLVVVEPPPETLEAFTVFGGALDAKVASNTSESSTLSALRNTLLPKLLSGELRVHDAEKAVEQVA